MQAVMLGRWGRWCPQPASQPAPSPAPAGPTQAAISLANSTLPHRISCRNAALSACPLSLPRFTIRQLVRHQRSQIMARPTRIASCTCNCNHKAPINYLHCLLVEVAPVAAKPNGLAHRLLAQGVEQGLDPAQPTREMRRPRCDSWLMAGSRCARHGARWRPAQSTATATSAHS